MPSRLIYIIFTILFVDLEERALNFVKMTYLKPYYRDAMYIVTLDRHNSMIDNTLGGFLLVADVSDYINHVQRLIVLNRLHLGYNLIIDVSGCVIQTQQTLTMLSDHMAAVPKARRIAVVVGASVASGQFRRIFNQEQARLVPDRQRGMAWIAFKTERENATP